MTSIVKIISTFILILFISACGSSDSDGGTQEPITEKSTMLIAEDSPILLTINQEQNILVGGGALRVDIYDQNNTLIKRTDNKPTSVSLSPNNYIISVRESTSKYSDSIGVYFNLIENFDVKPLPLGSVVYLKERSAKMYTIHVDNLTKFYVDASRSSVYVYNDSLSEIWMFDSSSTSKDHFLNLDSGDYYVIVDTNTFIFEGSFTFTTL
jgi:hypothetical protein